MTITLAAAPTAWASDTNYSSGPANGSAIKVDPGAGRFAQGWVPGDTLPAQHLNFHLAAVTAALADIISKVSLNALDGIGGGSYTPTAPIDFLGAQPVNFHTIGIDSTGIFTIPSGGKMNVFAGGLVELDDPEDLTIENAAGAFRLTLTPATIETNTGGVDPSWKPRIVSGAPCGWMQNDTNAAFAIAFPVNLNPGDDIVAVTALVDGSQAGVDHAAMPAGGDRVLLSLVQVNGNGVPTVLATRADQSANVAAYNAQHTIVLTNGALDSGAMPQTVDEDFAYYVVLHGATGANAEADKFAVLSLSGTTVARSYRTELITL